jgi:excinuclease ABC subunit C
MSDIEIRSDANDIEKKAALFPDKPGLYIMKNEKKKIIYVGKAKSLKKRIRSYFNSGTGIKTQALMDSVRELDFIITRNEYEALILENNLIKQWYPHFNIRLKDGKTYPMIRITNEPFPRVFKTRRIILDGSEYYAPFPDGSRVDLYMDIIHKLFPLRRCKGAVGSRKYPCLYYHMKLCSGACAGLISEEKYDELVAGVRKLLGGKTADLKAELELNMKASSDAMKYEDAARYRDSIATLDHVSEVQKVVDFHGAASDYVGFYTLGSQCTYVVLKVRSGNIAGKEVFQTNHYTTDEDALVQFVLQYYSSINLHPDILYLPIETDTEAIESFFVEKCGKKVSVRVPLRGRHLEIANMAILNAREDLELAKQGALVSGALEELKNVLRLPALPVRIEGFDISHLSGKFTVASMVSFENGKPDKGSYRYFKMRTLPEGRTDDYESIREAVARRYSNVINEDEKKPDLVVIDGGLGQVNAASHILRSLGLSEIPCIGLAKKNEEIYFPAREIPLTLERTSSALHILIAVRDESHRFATGLNKRLRKKSLSKLALENVKGIGTKKSAILLRQFGSLDNIMNASIEEIRNKAKISDEAARSLIDYLREHFFNRASNLEESDTSPS